MRHSRLLVRSFESVSTSAPVSRYICPSCRRYVRFNASLKEQRRYASNANLPLTERIRRKIWGTDNPPGLADPYGGPSFLERRRAEREGRILPEPGSVQEQTQLPQTSRRKERPAVPEETHDEKYVQADYWEGLEVVGGSGHWSERPVQEADHYVRFDREVLVGEPLENNSHLVSAMHQATIEIFAYQNSGRNAIEVCDDTWHEEAAIEAIQSTQISISTGSNEVELRYAGKGNEEELIAWGYEAQVEDDSTRGEEVQASEQNDNPQTGMDNSTVDDSSEVVEDVLQPEPVDRIQYFALYPVPADRSFLALSLSDLELRFAFAKRITQLTGHNISDHVLTHKITNLSSLLEHLLDLSKSKPTKVFENLMGEPNVQKLSNVTLMRKRQTLKDRETQRGLAKVIAQQLQERGLVETPEEREQAQIAQSILRGDKPVKRASLH